jgi:glycine/D-amino acid oxidase-like deaminating enzyme
MFAGRQPAIERGRPMTATEPRRAATDLGGERDYRRVSYWLETAGDLTPRPRLDGSITADVAILGAGFTGLWTAYALLERDPSLRVVVLESEIAGFGASGRNGGWCYPGFPVSSAVLRERFGADAARAVAAAMHGAVDDVARVVEAEGIDCGFLMSGALRIARGRHQLPAIEGAYRAAQSLGLADHYRWLSAAEVAERVRVTDVVGGLFMPHGAAVQPAKLARGLAEAVERRGATIYERTPVTAYRPGRDPRFETPFGTVRARALVLAGEAYLTRLAPLRRAMIPVYSLIVLSEPIPAERWAEVGWQGRELLASCRMSIDYLQRTADGRILFGGRGAPYRFGSRLADDMDRHEPTHAALRGMVAAWFPALRGVGFTHAWGGPLGMPRDWMPTMRYDAAEGVAGAWGYTGSGVATANLSGRVLADLITGRRSELTALPTVNHRSKPWEPEPLRWAGVRFVQEGFARLDARTERTGQPPTGRTLVERLGRR